jgi:hypothetical protein
MRKKYSKGRVAYMKREVSILKRTGPIHPPLPRSVNPLFRLAHHGLHQPANPKIFTF